MKVEFLWDEEMDGDDPLGELRLSDERDTISVPFTYVDAWMYGLKEGIAQLRTGKSDIVVIDLIDEPDPLVFENHEGSIKISYCGVSIHVENIDEIDSAFKSILRTDPEIERALKVI